MLRICVIGGAGFIGSYLNKLILNKHEVFVVDKKPAPVLDKRIGFIQADIRDREVLLQKFPENIDVVILLAAEHSDDVHPTSLYYDVNVAGAGNVLNVMAAKNISRLIFTSSVAVYGLNKNCPDESSPTDPFNHYGKSKLQAEELLRKWYETSSTERHLTIIRPTVTFGPGNIGNVYNLLKQVSSGKFVMIGKGDNKKSMAYVENVAAFINHSIFKISGFQLYNYVDKPDLSTKQLVVLVEGEIGKKILPVKIPFVVGYLGATALDVYSKLSGKKFSITAVRVKKFCATTQFISINIKSTGFKPPFELQKALRLTIADILKKRVKKQELEFTSES